MPFLILFIFFPIAEFIFFAKVSTALGLGTSFLLLILAALIGTAMINQQGLSVLLSARTSLQDEKRRTRELFDSLCIIAAGVALFIPGFLSDIFGILLLLPPVRSLFLKKLSEGGTYAFTEVHFTTHDQYRARDHDVIEAEYEKIEKSDET